MPVGGVYGEHRAAPVGGWIGPAGGVDPDAKQPDGAYPQPYKRPIVNNPADKGYPGAYPDGKGPF
ncbi:UNVERIFIED_CONTAM: hypothetical protein HDU68_003460 [Siphonaria sp. JEL0065]|nr:hypothetical protein HDU68_003460 [Siphonaria sp. JEL0065]